MSAYGPSGTGLFPEGQLDEPDTPDYHGPYETFWSHGRRPVRTPEEEAECDHLAEEVRRIQRAERKAKQEEGR